MLLTGLLSKGLVGNCIRTSAGIQRRALHITASLAIKEGEKLPNEEVIEGEKNKVKLADFFGKKRGILIGVPGAFTPGCSQKHLPSYVDNYSKLQEKGIDVIACLSVNDPYVMAAWAKDRKTDGKVYMLADPSAKATKKLNMDKDLAPLGGVRSKRFSMLIEDGKVSKIFEEPDGVGVTCTVADNMLKELNSR